MTPHRSSGFGVRGLLDRVFESARCFRVYKRLKGIKGIGPVVRWAARVAFPDTETRWMEVAAGPGQGLALLVHPRYDHAFVRGDHEPDIQHLVSSWLGRGDVFFDVGAHVGFFSLIAGRLVGSDGAVFAFEPDPDNFARLERNTARNGMQWIHSYSAVVSQQSGTVSFSRATPASSRMGGRILVGESATSEVLQIRAVTLDDHYDGRRGVVKIDVEGGEIGVLRGASRMLAEGNLRWIVEAHDNNLQALALSIFENASYDAHTVNTTHDTEYGRHYVVAAREAVEVPEWR